MDNLSDPDSVQQQNLEQFANLRKSAESLNLKYNSVHGKNSSEFHR